jgi:hypothetical protein
MASDDKPVPVLVEADDLDSTGQALHFSHHGAIGFVLGPPLSPADGGLLRRAFLDAPSD